MRNTAFFGGYLMRFKRFSSVITFFLCSVICSMSISAEETTSISVEETTSIAEESYYLEQFDAQNYSPNQDVQSSELVTDNTEITSESDVVPDGDIYPIVGEYNGEILDSGGLLEETSEQTTEDVSALQEEYSSETVTEETSQETTLAPEVFFNEQLGGYGIRNYDGEINYISPAPEIADCAARVNRNNQFLKTNVTIMIGDMPFVLTQEQKARCLAGINTDEPYIDKNVVWQLSNNICILYNHYNNETFYTSSGNIIKITCGDYGWSVDFTGLTDSIYDALSTKTDATLKYTPRNYNNNVKRPSMYSDIGSDYVEVDLSKQKIWVYKDNKLVIEDDCVTGKKGHETPVGVWSLKCNNGRTELVGPTWDVWVNYWMHFSQGCGLHDASWQRSFGLARWQAGYGSHGCVNLKPSTAAEVRKLVHVGEPVIVYYS